MPKSLMKCLLFQILLLIVPIYSFADDNWESMFAQSSFQEDDPLFWGEEETIYSATKYIKRLKEAPAIATVITGDQIKRMGARDILDVLKTVPGIGISVTTGWKIFGIESRGLSTSDSAGVLFLIDGHKVNEPLSGGTTWVFNHMMLDNVKRVEVIRGPGSALYGANAFVAVINVVTKGANDIDGIVAKAGAGSFGTQHYNLMLGKSFSDIKVAATVDVLDSDGSKLLVDGDLFGKVGRTDDWKNQIDSAVKVEYGDFIFHGRYAFTKRGGYIGVANALNDGTAIRVETGFADLIYNHEFDENLHLQTKAYFDEYHFRADWEIFPKGSPGFPNGYYGTPLFTARTMGLETQLDYSLSETNNLTVGALYEKIRQYDVKSITNFVDVSATNNWNKNVTRKVSAIYLQDVWRFHDDVEATFGARYDDYSDFGGSFNPRAGIVWNFTGKAHVKLLYGSAFRAPNFKELYNANNLAQLGNPTLSPETIKTYEASLGYQFTERFSGSITYFNNEIQDSINIIAGQYQNQGSIDVDGMELELKLNYSGINYSYLNYTYQNPRNADTGERLPFVASHKANLGFNYEINKYLNLNSNLFVSSGRPREKNDTRGELAGYQLLDLTLIGKNFFNTAEIKVSVHNLLNQKYQDSAEIATNLLKDFPRERTSFMVEVSYTF